MNKILILIVALLLGLFSSTFIVNEGENGIVLQFSKVKRDSDGKPVVYPPGLHFKVPFIDTVRVMDARIQTLDDQPDRFVTSEKKDLIIDSYVKWKIDDLSVYYLATGGNKMQAEALLKRKINNGLRSEIGSHSIKDIVSGKRGQLMETALKRMARSSELGIKVVDVRIKKINLPDEVSISIYKRMRAEREAVAKEHRSQGQEKSEVIRANIDRKVSIMLAKANKKALEVRGVGDATASKIYSDSYSQDPKFFAFLRSMSAYEKSFSDKNDVMILSPDSEFFKFMKTKG
ncbi:HflC protein [Psychromonas sp. CNPT3]|uniref:protease modulator HflC n=1 Tax=Psychromonas sp. CNPT3 TaxID=314282 RepID=UPI0002C0E9A6|nr:protease modulator HflC [Psychromonas sp. CNPT3]AGH80386.1 HflC protein [Psychromonas sp. CNPT3]